MQVAYATEATPGCVNEDHVIAGPNWWAVLDGATKRVDVDSGCSHGVAWLVRHLAGALAERLARERGEPLPDLLADAIKATCDGHADTCDLSNPDSPSTTVAMLRKHNKGVDWLVLADSPLALEIDGTVTAVLDDRAAHLPSYTTEAIRTARNSPDGFWVASTRPEAAYEAVSGSVAVERVRRAALFTDGAARLVERYGVTDWSGMLNMLDVHGPGGLIERTRAAEHAETNEERAGRRGKHFDDATVVFVRFTQ